MLCSNVDAQMHSEMTEDIIMYRRAPADIKPK